MGIMDIHYNISPPFPSLPLSACTHCLQLPGGGGVEGLLQPCPLTPVYGLVRGVSVWEG